MDSVKVIQSISVPEALCPLYEYIGVSESASSVGSSSNKTISRKSYPNLKDVWCWYPGDSGSDSGIKVPVALAGSQQGSIIKLNVKKPAEWPAFEKVAVTAKIARSELVNSEILFESITWNSETFECRLKHAKRPLPWSFVGQVTWTFTNTTTRAVLQQQVTDIELYVLSPFLPAFLKEDGIPLELLRIKTLLPNWMTKDLSITTAFKDTLARWLGVGRESMSSDWPGFVASTLFHDTRFEYGEYFGNSSYVSPGSKPEIWIDLWLSDLNGIERRYGTVPERYFVNCVDLSYLVQLLAWLGSSKSTTILDVWKIEPYKENIVQQKLIGQPQNAPKKFERHQIVTVKDTSVSNQKLLVLDACYGPQLGKQDFDTYLQLAESNKPIQSEAAAKKLVQRVCLARELRLDSGLGVKSLYSLMQDTFKDDNILPPCDMVIQRPNESKCGIMAIWTIHNKEGQEAHVSILRLRGTADLGEAFESRMSLLPENSYERRKKFQNTLLQPLTAEGLHGAELWSTGDKDAYYLYAHAKLDDKNWFLVIIEGTIPIVDITKPTTGVASRLRTAVLDQLPKANVGLQLSTEITHKIEVKAETNLRYKFYPFQVDLTLTDSMAKFWRGFQVDPKWKKAKLLSCTSLGNGTKIRATFLPLTDSGTETLVFQVYGANIDTTIQYEVLVELKDCNTRYTLEEPGAGGMGNFSVNKTSFNKSPNKSKL